MLDFHRGRSGAKGWKGKDHWHHNGGDEHLKPGDVIDITPAPAQKRNPACKVPNRAPNKRGIPNPLLHPPGPFLHPHVLPIFGNPRPDPLGVAVLGAAVLVGVGLFCAANPEICLGALAVP